MTDLFWLVNWGLIHFSIHFIPTTEAIIYSNVKNVSFDLLSKAKNLHLATQLWESPTTAYQCTARYIVRSVLEHQYTISCSVTLFCPSQLHWQKEGKYGLSPLLKSISADYLIHSSEQDLCTVTFSIHALWWWKLFNALKNAFYSVVYSHVPYMHIYTKPPFHALSNSSKHPTFPNSSIEEIRTLSRDKIFPRLPQK